MVKYRTSGPIGQCSAGGGDALPDDQDILSAALFSEEEKLELALASEVQAALLPNGCPAHCSHQVAATRNRMCGSVGGDFYDFIRLNEDQTAFVIGDVVGHGVRASLLMAKIMGFLRSDTHQLARPTTVIEALNRMLIDLGERTGAVLPCSVFYGVLDTPSGTGFFLNAGHPEPLLCHRETGEVRLLGAHDLLLGVQEYTPAEMCHTFQPGERLVLYTDGLPDACNAAGEYLGMDRFRRLLQEGRVLEAEELADHVFAEVDRFRDGAAQSDDETLVVLDRM